MSINERISKIEKYFNEMQIVSIDGKRVIYVVVVFPNNWVIDEEIEEKFKVTINPGTIKGEFYFCTDIENGEDVIFDAIEYNIEKMKEAIERAQLLGEKTKELRMLFENENITLHQLRNLKISYEEENIIIPSSTIDVNNSHKKKEKNNTEIKQNNNE